MSAITPYYKSPNRDFTLIQGDCRELLSSFEFKFDMIFADPPYFLSNGGISVSCGKKVCVDKGDWDKGGTPEYIEKFNKEWLTACCEKLNDNGTIWVSGTHHNIFSVATQLSELGFKILNVVTWAKTDPPENLSHRMLTHASEFVIWAKKTKKANHKYNYELMKSFNEGKQMTDVWILPAVQKWEKSCGKHPTQKPLPLLARIILACTKEGDWVLDPFNGSGTTGIAASLLKRRFLGIDQDTGFLELSKKRREELEDDTIRNVFQEKLLADCHSSIVIDVPKTVLVGRVGSDEQWDWLMSSHCYNIPVSKILSMPKLLSADYVLLFMTRNTKQAKLFKVSKVNPQIKTREQIAAMSKEQYTPHRDNSYWVLHLAETKDVNLRNKEFILTGVIGKQELRGAFWIKPLDKVVEAFK